MDNKETWILAEGLSKEDFRMHHVYSDGSTIVTDGFGNIIEDEIEEEED